MIKKKTYVYIYINLYYNTTIFLNYVYQLHIFFILSIYHILNSLMIDLI